MKRHSSKKQEEAQTPVEKRSISGSAELFSAAEVIMQQRMIKSFSEYVRTLIRKDLGEKAA